MPIVAKKNFRGNKKVVSIFIHPQPPLTTFLSGVYLSKFPKAKHNLFGVKSEESAKSKNP